MPAVIDLHLVYKAGKATDVGNEYETFSIHRWYLKITKNNKQMKQKNLAERASTLSLQPQLREFSSAGSEHSDYNRKSQLVRNKIEILGV